MENNTTAAPGFHNQAIVSPVSGPAPEQPLAASPLDVTRLAALEARVKILENTIEKHVEYFARIRELTKLLEGTTLEKLHS
jgi:hypothetical protein